MGLGVYYLPRHLAFASRYGLMDAWHPQPKLPPASNMAMLASTRGPLGSGGDPGDDTNCRPLFCEETFYNCSFGDHTPILSHTVNDRVSSSHPCHMVFDYLGQRAVPSCLKASIPLLV